MTIDNDFERDPAPRTVSRKPCGYWCNVALVDRVKKRALIHDAHAGKAYWVSFKTLGKDWRRNP